jgi:periplasmic mercuric ion binding protein
MKTIKLLFAMLLAFATFQSANAQSDKTDRFKDRSITITSFKVYGECGSCRHRIENALKVPGIVSAKWNEEDQFLTVQYKAKDIILDKIYLLVAAVGHDTEKVKADDAVYQKLPDCCHYQRQQS